MPRKLFASKRLKLEKIAWLTLQEVWHLFVWKQKQWLKFLFQVVLLFSRTILAIFQLPSIFSNTPIYKIYGKNTCPLFTVVQFASLWQTVVGGFGMAFFRYLCLKKPALFHRLGQVKYEHKCWIIKISFLQDL